MEKLKKTKINYFAIVWFLYLICAVASVALGKGLALPGDDKHSELKAAGTLLHLVDSWVFTFGARLLAGLSILSAGWNLKEQRFAMAIICVFAAIMIGTVPMWVKNIFEIGGHGNLFDP